MSEKLRLARVAAELRLTIASSRVREASFSCSGRCAARAGWQGYRLFRPWSYIWAYHASS